MWSYINGLIRHGLTTFGGAFVTQGYLTGDELTTIVAGVATAAGVAWSLLSKKLAKQ